MWVRSQDKKSLRKYTGFFINEQKETEICADDQNDINSYFVIGEYKTKERALEILDCLHNFKIDLYFEKLKALSRQMDWDAFIQTNSAVFEMPNR